MRVVHVSFFVDPAGRAPGALLDAWPTLARLGPAIAGDDVEVTVVQAAADDAVVTRSDVTYHFIAARAPTIFERRLGHWATPVVGGVIERVVRLKPDVVHVHSLSFPRHVRRLREMLPATHMIVQDHADHPLTGWRRHLVNARLGGVDAVAFTAAEQAAPFHQAGLIDPGVAVYAVPESSSDFTPGDVEEARRETGLSGDPCLLWIGHLDANKDPLTMLRAIRSVALERPGVHLWMAWLRAPLLRHVKREIDNDELLRERVTLLGPQPHTRIEALLRAADLLVQASHSEGSGYAVIEAMATGTAPVVSDIPSFRALTGHGQAGGLFPVGDAPRMAAAILEWNCIAHTGRESRVRGHFDRHLSFHAIGARWREIYRLSRT